MPVIHQLGSACNFSGSCHLVFAKSYQVHRVIFGKCAMPALQQLTVLAQKRENHGKHICFPKSFPHVFQLFPRCLRFPMFFTTFSPAFHPFFHRCSPTFPPMKFTISGQAKPWCSEMVSRLRFRWLHDKISWITCCMLRKDPKGPKSVMWHILNHWTWLVT